MAHCRIVCIDTFAGGVEHQIAGPFVAEVPLIEQRFDRNLAAFADRVENIRSVSVPALQRLAAERRQFDLAYIDGSHMSCETASRRIPITRGRWCGPAAS